MLMSDKIQTFFEIFENMRVNEVTDFPVGSSLWKLN